MTVCLFICSGEEIGNVYDRERLMEYIKITQDYNRLEADEMNIISGALRIKKIKVSDIMTKIEDVFMLPVTAKLDFETVNQINVSGYSRIPIYDGDRNNVVGILHAKDLAFVDTEDKIPVKTHIEFYKHPLYFVYEDVTLDLMLNEFKQGKSHMAFVRKISDDGINDPVYKLTGIVTLEDVIEEVIQAEIVDETDIISMIQIFIQYILIVDFQLQLTTEPKRSEKKQQQDVIFRTLSVWALVMVLIKKEFLLHLN